MPPSRRILARRFERRWPGSTPGGGATLSSGPRVRFHGYVCPLQACRWGTARGFGRCLLGFSLGAHGTFELFVGDDFLSSPEDGLSF